MNKKIHWFTFVELIITIAVIAIIWTIWFISFSNSIPDSRDTTRIAHLREIDNSLNVFRLKNMLIIPDRGIEIRVDWFVVWYQWYLSEDILELINYTWVDWWIDPKDKEYYTYYVSRDFKKYQLLWYLENEKNLDQSTFLTYKTYAETIDYKNRFPYMLWDNLWIIIDKQSNSPIQSLPNIQSDWYINFTWSLAWIYNINIENWDIFMSNDNILLWEKIKELANIKYNVLTEESTSDLCSWEISDVNWADTSVWNPKYISSYNWTRSDTP